MGARILVWLISFSMLSAQNALNITVLDSKSEEPIESAVIIAKLDDETFLSGISDSLGKISLHSESNSFKVNLKHPVYRSTTLSFKLAGCSQAHLTIYMENLHELPKYRKRKIRKLRLFLRRR